MKRLQRGTTAALSQLQNVFYNPAGWWECFYGCDRFWSSAPECKGTVHPIIKTIKNMYFLLPTAHLLKLEISASFYIQ